MIAYENPILNEVDAITFDNQPSGIAIQVIILNLIDLTVLFLPIKLHLYKFKLTYNGVDRLCGI